MKIRKSSLMKSMLSGLLLVVGLLSALVLGATVPPDDPNIRWEGRWDRADPSVPRQAWSVAGFRVAFTGATGVFARFRDLGPGPNWFRAWVDGAQVFSGANDDPSRGFGVGSGLDPSAVHTLRVAKRNEASSGESVLVGLELFGGDAKTVPWQKPLPTRRVEVVGDSVACGYCNLGHSPEPYSLNASDATQTFAAFTADAFGAELFMECWSGIGYVRNCGDQNHTSEWPMPRHFLFTTTHEHGALWNASAWHPDVVVIRMGTNDYSDPKTSWPSDSQFMGGVVSFVELLLKQHPAAKVVIACGGTSIIPCPNEAAAVAKLASNRVHFLHLPQLDRDKHFGCAGHPNILGQQVLADSIVKVVKDIMGW